MIEDTNKTWDALQTITLDKVTSLVISAEMPGLQQSSSNTGSTDSGFTMIEKILNEVSEPFKNYPINAVHAPKNPKMKQNFT